MGHLFGVPFHRDLQRRVILEALEMVYTAERSGEVRTPPFSWAEARREGIRIERAMGLRD